MEGQLGLRQDHSAKEDADLSHTASLASSVAKAYPQSCQSSPHPSQLGRGQARKGSKCQPTILSGTNCLLPMKNIYLFMQFKKTPRNIYGEDVINLTRQPCNDVSVTDGSF